MWELRECLELKRQIDGISERIYELRTVITAPKNQVITGMPRGGGGDNPIERYIVRVERLEERRRKLIDRQDELWAKALEQIPNAEAEEKRLLYLRFVKGLRWEKCAYMMNEEYGKWNINRVFRVYRKFSKKN